MRILSQMQIAKAFVKNIYCRYEIMWDRLSLEIPYGLELCLRCFSLTILFLINASGGMVKKKKKQPWRSFDMGRFVSKYDWCWCCNYCGSGCGNDPWSQGLDTVSFFLWWCGGLYALEDWILTTTFQLQGLACHKRPACNRGSNGFRASARKKIIKNADDVHLSSCGVIKKVGGVSDVIQYLVWHTFFRGGGKSWW